MRRHHLVVFDNICAAASTQRSKRGGVFDFRRDANGSGGRASRADAGAVFSTLIGENR
ncbi:hypothetical protein THIX_20179 [Thiomonas sp. X19]|nr:hypothetical protein THIX_20179 [Thiomonas sp. X19]